MSTECITVNWEIVAVVLALTAPRFARDAFRGWRKVNGHDKS